MKRTLPTLVAAVILPLPLALASGSPTECGTKHGVEAQKIPTSIALASPSLTTNAPAVVSGSKIEDLNFSTEDNVRLTASFFLPRKKGRAHAVLLVHDAGSNRKQLEALGKKLQRSGFAVLSFDLRGHGDSTNNSCDWSKLEGNEQSRTWLYSQRDIAGAAEYLRTRDDVHTSSLTIVGHRSGGGAAIRYASNDMNVRAVVVLDPVQDELGFNLLKDLVKLEGLKTMFLSPKENRQFTDRLTKAANNSTDDGQAWVQPCFLKSDSDAFLGDKRLSRELNDWLRETIDPKE